MTGKHRKPPENKCQHTWTQVVSPTHSLHHCQLLKPHPGVRHVCREWFCNSTDENTGDYGG